MFRPVNRHVLINLQKKRDPAEESIIMLPEDYKPEEQRYVVVSVIDSSDDVRFSLEKGENIIVDRSMIEEICINERTFNVVLDNYIIGILH